MGSPGDVRLGSCENALVTYESLLQGRYYFTVIFSVRAVPSLKVTVLR